MEVFEPMTIYGDGLQKRSFSYVDDCIKPIWDSAFIDSDYRIFNIGSNETHTISEANAILREVVGGGNVDYLESRMEVKYAYCNHDLAKDILKFENKTSFKDGLKIMWEWVQKQPYRPVQKWNYYEIEKKIYKYWKN